MPTIDDVITAIYRKDQDRLSAILRHVNVNAPDSHGRTPLIHAILAEDADVRLIQQLIDSGAAVSIADKGQQWTPLAFAARDQRADIVQVLLDSGADVNAVDVFGNTPLWRCVMGPRTDPAVVKLLLGHGADPNRKNYNGKSALDVARLAGQDDLVAIMTSSGEPSAGLP